MNQREAFAEAVIGRLRLVLQKHEREMAARSAVATATENVRALDRIPEHLPLLIERRHLAKRQAEEQLAHANAMLDAALNEFSDHLFDTFHQDTRR